MQVALLPAERSRSFRVRELGVDHLVQPLRLLAARGRGTGTQVRGIRNAPLHHPVLAGGRAVVHTRTALSRLKYRPTRILREAERWVLAVLCLRRANLWVEQLRGGP